MNKLHWLIGLLAIGVLAGCNSDIVTTPGLKMLEHKCVHVSPIESEDPQVGKVIRDVIEKEFVKKRVELCDPDKATIFITGATFMTVRSTTKRSRQTIESVSVVGKDKDGQILLSASYDNKKQYTASKLAGQFGRALAGKLR
ncbi:MAG: hypothetical protein CEE38_04235 [Planctomycetes bacterium B3_Pla]|nr:MAG: hypothetical protein CEE38_04235 [Planctomycetes bacterium B3_Pla]